jgi:hypothetical protein
MALQRSHHAGIRSMMPPSKKNQSSAPKLARHGMRALKPASPSGERLGIKVKTAQQPFATGNSGVDGKTPITISKPPWETGK